MTSIYFEEDNEGEIFDESLYEEDTYNESKDCKINVKDYPAIDDKNVTEICLHVNSSTDNGTEVCIDCGIEIYKELSLEPEWRYYGNNDSKHGSDPSRCFIRKSDEKNIYKDIAKFDFPINIKEISNSSYLDITQGCIKRGNYRKALIFACVFNAYKSQNNAQNPEELREKFGLTRKDILKGLNFFNVHKTDVKTTAPIYISPIKFIPCVMKKFNANDFHIEEVTKLYHKIHNRSSLINRSNPLSVISGLVYYYFRLKEARITCTVFSKMVRLSDITISRISKNIALILKTDFKL